MFTGIVQAVCEVTSNRVSDSATQLMVNVGSLTEGLQIGASVAVNGTCLTAVSIEDETVDFDIVGETLDKTNLGELVPGSQVNIERSMSFGDEVGGHILSGHIDGTGIIHSISETDDNYVVGLQVDQEWMKYIQPKGFIAIDGASLTVADPDPQGLFYVHLIPETLRQTCIRQRSVGDRVNIELDQQTKTIVNTVERYMQSR